ncbi:MAG: mannose-1-phosphate guanylyltransferase [Microgenomates group bacterium]
MEDLKIVIFCGGYGTRMWPMSRQKFPKQFLPLVGDKSFFQLTVKRVRIGFPLERIFFSVPADQAHFVSKQIKGVKKENIIAEPERRDTLGAVALATAFIAKKFPQSLMAAIWGGDHLVKNEKRFIRLLKLACQVCLRRDVLVKIDVRPEFPATSLGWVKIGRPLEKIGGYTLYDFEKFIEKPNFKKAQAMLKKGGYLINTGYYVWRPEKVLALLRKYNPSCYSRIIKIQEAIGTKEEQKVLKREYSQIEKTSVDFGLFEKLPPESFGVFCADLGWSDIGTWDLLYEKLARGQRENVTKGEVISFDSQGNLVYLPKGKVAGIIGVENLIIVDTKDGLLVCKRGRGGEVKKLVEYLKKEGKIRYL